jgi:hypothetical protein
MAQVTKDQIKSAFTKWYQEYNNNPESFGNISDSDAAERSAEYFAELLTKEGATLDGE